MSKNPSRTLSLSLHRTAAAAALLAFAANASAQPLVQVLAVDFNVFIPAAPLSDWLTAGIALLLAATAVVMLRRQSARGQRLFGWMLALVTGATLLSVTGYRMVSEAQAVPPSAVINLVTSPGTLDLGPFFDSSPITVTVTNTTGKFAHINDITLDSGPYTVVAPTTCAVGLSLPPGGTCTITVDLQGT